MTSDFQPSGIMTLLTDFGTADGYVAAMKGTALSLNPRLCIVDVTHEVPQQDIFYGALVLKQVALTFPGGTVHVVVVDPGVGTPRLPLAVESGGQLFVGPDNGVLTLAAAPPRRAFRIAHPDLMQAKLSDTFHGRDVFAPAGAKLAGGFALEQAGPELDSIEEVPLPAPHRHPDRIIGEVIYADQYGNLMLNIAGQDLDGLAPDRIEVTVGGITISGLKTTYGDVARGELVIYEGSTGYLEVARREGDARHFLGAPRGTAVIVTHEPRS